MGSGGMEVHRNRRRGIVAVAAVILATSLASEASAPILSIIPQKAVNLQKLICPCVFDLGVQQDGEPLLIIDHNGTDQLAFVQINGSTIELPVNKAFRFQCRKGEEVTASWKAEDVSVRVKLTVGGPGEESCFFGGSLTATKAGRRETRRIVGGCGC
jgi:hypothetical protein